MLKNKKILFLIVVMIIIAPSFFVHAEPEKCPDGTVCLLEKITNPVTKTEVTQVKTLSDYLSFIFPLAIGLAALFALIMITIGGIEYIFSNIPGVKGEGLKRIQEAIWGLLLALAAYLILYTINPDLINLNFIIKK